MPTKRTCFLAVVVVAVLSSGTARTDDMIMTTGLRQDDGVATSVNLSHDLVRLGIASRDLPADDPSFDARPLFEAAIQYVRTHDIERLTVDRGAYYLLTPQDSQTYLRFPALSDLTVDLAGSKIFFAGAFLQGFTLANCDHATLTNFDIDFLEPPYTQVELVSIDPSARTLAYRTQPNWRDPATFDSPSVPGEASASLVLWGAAFRDGDILPGTSILNGVSHSTVDHVRVVPRQGALISANADGIHFVDAGLDNHIRRSFVTRTLDDAIAIDSLDPATVVSQTGPDKSSSPAAPLCALPTAPTSISSIQPPPGSYRAP
jgi:hypothetical protein